MAVARKKSYTAAEYLELEAHSEIRHEFVNGEIVAMSGGSAAHNRITLNTTFALETEIRKQRLPCQVFVNDLRLRIIEANLYTYPDVMLVCGKIEFDAGRQDVILNPVLIIEVLSESTSDYDHTRKFAAYRHIPALQEYVMIDQSRVSAEVFRRDGKFWVFEALEEWGDILQFKSVGIGVPPAAVYEQVELANEQDG